MLEAFFVGCSCIFMNVLECWCERSNDIAGAVSEYSAAVSYVYKRLQNLFLIVFRNYDVSELGVFLFRMMCFLNCSQSIFNCIWTLQTLILMYWTLNSDKIGKTLRIAKFVREFMCCISLTLVMMSKTQIDSSLKHSIIDMYIKMMLPISHCLNASE